MDATIMRPICRRVRRQLAWAPGLLALAVLLAAESGHAKADSLKVTLTGSQTIAASAAQDSTLSFHLDVVSNSSQPVSLNNFTIVDFAGYVPGSILAPPSWRMMFAFFDPAADAALAEIGGFDDPSVRNLVFSRRPIFTELSGLFGEAQNFQVQYQGSLQSLYYFVDHPGMAYDSGSTTTVGMLVNNPEPWNLLSLIVMALPAGLFYLTLRRRRASPGHLANPQN